MRANSDFDKYVNSLNEITNQENKAELESFYMLHSAVLQFFKAIDKAIQDLLKKSNVGEKVVKQLESVLPTLTKLKREITMLDTNTLCASYKSKVNRTIDYVKKDMIVSEVNDTARELFDLLKENKNAFSIEQKEKEQKEQARKEREAEQKRKEEKRIAEQKRRIEYEQQEQERREQEQKERQERIRRQEEDARKLADKGIVIINGVKWAMRNIGSRGTFVSKQEDCGKYYTWKEAKNACPQGWRLPTEAEFTSLINAGSIWTTKNGVNGRIFGTPPNQLFLPIESVINSFWNMRTNGFWSSTVDRMEKKSTWTTPGVGGTSYGLFFDSSRAATGAYSDDLKLLVRCVAE